jgi:protein O-mannosyl-transferase
MGKNRKTQLAQHVPETVVAVPGGMGSFKVPSYAIWLVLLFTAGVYSIALRNGITYVDDDMYLLRNPYITDFSLQGVKAIFTSFFEFNYHPFTTLTWLVEYRLFWLNPLPYHLLNVLLHLANTWLVYALARRLSGRDMTGLVVAILFAVHPLHVESVAWLSERKGLLCALFYFLSLIYYMRYIDLGLQRKHLLAALLFCIAALFSKSAAVTLPVVMLLIDGYRGRKIKGVVLAEKIPFVILSLIFGALAIWSQETGGAVNGVTDVYGVVNRTFIFLGGIAFYFLKAVVPFHLSAIHYFPNMDGGILPWPFYLSLPFLVLIGWLVARKISLKRDLVFGVFFFLAAISVMLQVITVGSAYAAERYSYVSYFGFFYIVGQWLSGLETDKRKMALGIFAVIALGLSAISWMRIPVWKNTETIYTDIIEKNEDNRNNYLVYLHWGDYYQAQGDLDEALKQYDKSIEIRPDYSRAYVRRGEIYGAKKDVISAILSYNEALRYDPKSAVAFNNKGWAYFEMGDKVLSVAYLDTALQLDNKMATAYNNRGWVKLTLGDSIAATKDFTLAITNAPKFPKPYYNRALIKMYSGKPSEAIKDYTSLIDVYPGDAQAYFNRAMAYMDLKDTVTARRDLLRSAELGSRDAEVSLKYLSK